MSHPGAPATRSGVATQQDGTDTSRYCLASTPSAFAAAKCALLGNALPDAVTTEPTVLALQCPVCETPQTMRVLLRHQEYTEEMDTPVEYTFIACTRCSAPILLSRELGFDGDDGPTKRVYPPLARQIGFPIPRSVRHGYDEAVRCEEAKAWTAAAVMVGRALEAICHEFDSSSTSIDDGLKKMLNAGAISQELYDWGDGLRVVRNEGAHATPERVSATDARFALDFLQALIEILFDLRERFAEWQEDRAERATRRTSKRATPISITRAIGPTTAKPAATPPAPKPQPGGATQ